MPSFIMTEKKPGEIRFAYGYEAVARGALEAGIKLAAGFPGTPSSGALKALASVAQDADIHVEWATNEKVAYEVAWGAAKNGQRALCTMNHLGMSVLMDPLKLSVYQGIRGGLVLFVGDDIGANTSAYESDSRLLASSADMPILTPSTPNEALTMTKYAFELSEALGCPVMLRSVCQLLMTRSLIKVGEIDATVRASGFAPSPNRKPPYGRAVRSGIVNHRYAREMLKRADTLVTEAGFYRMEGIENKRHGVIACGVCYDLTLEALQRIGFEQNPAVLKMNVANPINEELVGGFIQRFDKVLVLEEGDPFIEERVLAIAAKQNKPLEVVGRTSGHIPVSGEMFVNDIHKVILEAFSDKLISQECQPTQGSMPFLDERPIALCAGCGHMSLFYALRKAMEEYNGGKYTAAADAGCAFMCTIPPVKSLQANADMGGSIGMVTGAAFSGHEDPLIAVTGDGGFFHGGLNGLANAIYNRAPVNLIITDNGTLGNTGLQTTASTGYGASGNAATKVDIEGLCRAMGAPYVRRVNPYHFRETKLAIKELMDAPKPAVLVAEQDCALIRLRDEKQRNKPPVTARIDATKCTACGACMQMYCSAIAWPGYQEEQPAGIPRILSNLCTGCGVCLEVCPNQAISEEVK